MIDRKQDTVGGATPRQVIVGIQASKLNLPMRDMPISQHSSVAAVSVPALNRNFGFSQ